MGNIGNTRTELLAPCGNYEGFLGALNAGADAFYLGGDRFGARAYAQNFSTEEICKAIHVAHFYGKKIYLTLNTLIKSEEIGEIEDYVSPMYLAGLDGVIIQDLGVLQVLKEHFPGLELHASTQMFLTGSAGAELLKQYGVTRIVPARELSLQELIQLKQDTGLELECFIHGAMCYCYSGQCLFSSILGERSGNRGRCAQPCRLPYQIAGEKNNGYPLSLKDMCTLPFLPKILSAGIDSLKIEGRMKRPEYAAGVTAIYRKYIDRYYAYGEAAYQVEAADYDVLRKLYIRSQIQTGYYERRNGKDMITLTDPSYGGTDEGLLLQIRNRYIKEPEPAKVSVYGYFHEGEQAILTMDDGNGICVVSENGLEVQTARSGGMGKEAFEKAICKTGNTLVQIQNMDLELSEQVFYPVGKLNELRRDLISAYEQTVIASKGFVTRDLQEIQILMEPGMAYCQGQNIFSLDISVSTKEQLDALLHVDILPSMHQIRRVYVPMHLLESESVETWNVFREKTKCHLFAVLPYVCRRDDVEWVKGGLAYCVEQRIEGVLVRNLEQLSLAQSYREKLLVIMDAGLYQFNEQTVLAMQGFCNEWTLPYELNWKEIRGLLDACKAGGMKTAEDDNTNGFVGDFADDSTFEAQSDIDIKSLLFNSPTMILYGRIPMMITANCIQKTSGKCHGKGTLNRPALSVGIKDRYDVFFPVHCDCTNCYNVVYNSVVYSLYGNLHKIMKSDVAAGRLDFVYETAEEMKEILRAYTTLAFQNQKSECMSQLASTTGHFKRGTM